MSVWSSGLLVGGGAIFAVEQFGVADRVPGGTNSPETAGDLAAQSGWSRVAHDETVFGGSEDQWMTMHSVVSREPGLVAVGGPPSISPYELQAGDKAAVWTYE